MQNRTITTILTQLLVVLFRYASRVKLIKNDASKMADSKEVARLKQIIAKLKAGEQAED